MRHIKVKADLPTHTSRDIFPLLCDIKKFPEYTDAIADLTIDSSTANSVVSKWTVRFGPELVTWTQCDEFEPETNTIRFKRLSGDIEHFAGTWTLIDTDDGCTVKFAAEFDIGVAGLGMIIEPLIESLLRKNINALLKGFSEYIPDGSATQ